MVLHIADALQPEMARGPHWLNRFAIATPGLEHRPSRQCVPRHRHARAYAALVLEGGYEEAGEHGQLRVRSGDVLMHGAFEAHLNRMAHSGALILNIELPSGSDPSIVLASVADPDAIVRVLEHDPHGAAQCLLDGLQSRPAPSAVDWPDQLARDLIADPALRLGEWARSQGLAAATLSRGFRQVFGLAPAAFRSQVRARQAWHCIVGGNTTLAQIAAGLGFADQAHMTRAVRSLTGRPAGAWRSS